MVAPVLVLPAYRVDAADGPLVHSLGITGLSEAQVSEMAKSLDAAVEVLRTRPRDAVPYAFVAVDALVLHVRAGGRTAGVHAF